MTACHRSRSGNRKRRAFFRRHASRRLAGSVAPATISGAFITPPVFTPPLSSRRSLFASSFAFAALASLFHRRRWG